MQLLLGVDGGGSRTRAAIADLTGEVLGSGEAGGSNYRSVGFAAATHTLQTAIAAARGSAAVEPGTPFAAACFGLAGAGRPADQQRFVAWATQQAIAAICSCVSDAELVLAAGTPTGGWGVALICGTGSFCWARAADGRSLRVGGWGYLLGDEGSGYDLACRALRLATQTADGRADAQAILQAVLDRWGLGDPLDLISHVYGSEITRPEIADLSRQVLKLAEAGDHHASSLLESAAVDLSQMVRAAVRGLDLHLPPLALAGGLLGASPALRTMIVRHTALPLGPVTYVGDPIQGAIALARALLSQS